MSATNAAVAHREATLDYGCWLSSQHCSVSLSVCVLIAHFWAKCRGQILVEKHAGGHDLFIYECICSSAASLNL